MMLIKVYFPLEVLELPKCSLTVEGSLSRSIAFCFVTQLVYQRLLEYRVYCYSRSVVLLSVGGCPGRLRPVS
jgi:hypothetical protein